MKQEKKKEKKIVCLALLPCVLSLIIMTAALCHPKRESGEFVPPSFDETAQTGTPEVPDGLGWQELDAKAFRVSVCGKIIPNGNSADVWLSSPESNTVWLKLRVLNADGEILGETGLIRPGEYVQSVTLYSIPKSGTKITLKLMAYQPDTYYSEGVVTFETSIRAAEADK